MTIHRCQSANIHAQAAGDAGADGSDVQLLAFDLAGFDDILGQRHQAGLNAQGRTDVSQAPEQQTLRPAHRGHGYS